ncbi:hypothetical protein ABPG73_009003 [Tetrahymena malaccensis]
MNYLYFFFFLSINFIKSFEWAQIQLPQKKKQKIHSFKKIKSPKETLKPQNQLVVDKIKSHSSSNSTYKRWPKNTQRQITLMKLKKISKDSLTKISPASKQNKNFCKYWNQGRYGKLEDCLKQDYLNQQTLYLHALTKYNLILQIKNEIGQHNTINIPTTITSKKNSTTRNN